MVIVDENLDLAGAFIEKAAMEKSISDVSEALSAALALRKKHRERSTQPFVDPAFTNGAPFFATAQEDLRPHPGGLTVHQVHSFTSCACRLLCTTSLPRTPSGTSWQR